MDRGVLWLCRVTAAPSAMTKPQVILWQSRGQERSFRLDAIEWHASTIMVDAIMAGRWLRGRPDEDAA
jgi:hypothetical protein